MQTALNSSMANKTKDIKIKCRRTSGFFYVVRRSEQVVTVGVPNAADEAEAMAFARYIADDYLILLKSGWSVRKNSDGVEFWTAPEGVSCGIFDPPKNPWIFYGITIAIPALLVIGVAAYVLASL